MILAGCPARRALTLHILAFILLILRFCYKSLTGRENAPTPRTVRGFCTGRGDTLYTPATTKWYVADKDNYPSHSVPIKIPCGTGLPFCCVSLSYLLSLTLWTSPFGGAEALAPPGAKDVAEPKGLAGVPG